MRILHVEKFLPASGGVGSYVRRLGELQRSAGHQVQSFGCVPSDGPAEMPLANDFTVARGPVALARMIHNGQAAAKLEALLRRWPADVAHLHNVYHHLTPSILPVLARRGVGAVMTVHDYRLACPMKFFLRSGGVCTRCLPHKFYHAASPRCAGLGGAGLALESLIQRLRRAYFRWVSLFLCPTRFVRRVLIATGLPASKAVICRNVIEPVALPAAATRAPREVLWAARLTPEKAPRLALELAERLPDVKVVIAGDGPLLGELRREAEQRKIPNVELPGHVEHQDMGRYLARATAVVLTSLWFENSPQTMLEAMSAGRCVIVPDHPPLREWVQDGQTGRLFVPGDVESLTKVTRQVLSDAAGRERMERAARELAARRHEPGALTARIEGLYQEAIRRCALR